MLQEVTDVEQKHTFRPMFLSVLCIISVIGSIGFIVESTVGIFKADEAVAKIQSGTQKTQLKNIFAGNKVVNAQPLVINNLTPDNFQKFSIGSIVAALLSLIGAILMWLLQKTGFYSFTLGTFFNLITHFLLFGENIGAMGLSLIGAILGLIFVILYSQFLKYMD